MKNIGEYFIELDILLCLKAIFETFILINKWKSKLIWMTIYLYKNR